VGQNKRGNSLRRWSSSSCCRCYHRKDRRKGGKEIKSLDDIGKERINLLEEVKKLISFIKSQVDPEIDDLAHGIQILETLRQNAYEDMNQILHATMILDAATDIEKGFSHGQRITWKWNPRQTGSIDEPDLQGTTNGKVIVSAEITTSKRPIGTIDKRMAITLEKLSKFDGKRFYYVRTQEMATRARTKIREHGYQVEVRILGNRPI